jgi:hypothetical protein
MQVEFVHGDNLAITTTGSTTLNTKRRPLARLTNVGKNGLAQVGTQGLRETDRRRRFTLAKRSGRNAKRDVKRRPKIKTLSGDGPGHDDVFAVPDIPTLLAPA